MKFAVKGAAVVAVVVSCWIGLWASPVHAAGVREYRLPPADEPAMGDPDSPGGSAIARPVGEMGVSGRWSLTIMRIGPTKWIVVLHPTTEHMRQAHQR